MHCSVCNKVLIGKQKVYCSNLCQHEAQYQAFIKLWKTGRHNGQRGITSIATSKYIKKYLLDKYKSRCGVCAWNKKHPVTGKVPLEIHHIDGNAQNNQETNLRLLCPNCHSLTPTFRNLNKGRGRLAR